MAKFTIKNSLFEQFSPKAFGGKVCENVFFSQMFS